MKCAKITFLLVMFTLSYSVQYAQIAISPPYVLIDGRSGVGSIYITNNSDQPQEVGISFTFGYPSSDAEGNLIMNYTDTVAFKKYALDSVVRAFPRSFILPGKQQRTVRVQVKPPPGMKDGFYFTRAKILAKPQTADVTKPVAEGISTKISYNFEQIIPAYYRRGKLTTGLKIEKIIATQKDSILVIMAQLDRLGDAPFIGSMIANLMDAKGKVIATTKSSTTAYFNVLRRLELNIVKVTPGAYKVEVTFETKRGDMASGDLVQAQPVKELVDVLIK